MPIKSIRPDYRGEYKDGIEHFNGQQLLNICWEKHTMLGWPMCVPVPATLTFGQLIDNVLPGIYAIHPDFEKIDWDKVQWSTSKGPLIPNRNKSLREHELRHKAQIRFRTPELNGHNNGG
ncbi:phenol hydroxylase subunit P4 [Zhongshania sp. BJYM1]|uniref:phenol hydroxylase subunit P4 n=1 Tax=Zhongshania aquatica TaxID=2965069 RepID=UPI0022B450C5|nr:phenol hydroxylase subunit P4 [Marortus sp. BJYM1]